MDLTLFGIGFDRILLILVVALIIFGPDKLPGMARQAGKWVNELRRLSQEARGEIRNLTQEMDLQDLNKVREDLASLRGEIAAAGKDLIMGVQEVQKEVDVRDALGQPLATQYEQHTYQVEKLPEAADGSESGYKLEETIQRETIIQDLVNNSAPATISSEVTIGANGHLNAEATTNEVAAFASPATTTPQPVSEPAYSAAEVVPATPPTPSLSSESQLRQELLSLEGQVASQRQELYERLESLERQVNARLERLESLLSSQVGQGPAD